jgi:hypothetical protein
LRDPGELRAVFSPGVVFMQTVFRIVSLGILCVLLSALGVFVLTDPDWVKELGHVLGEESRKHGGERSHVVSRPVSVLASRRAATPSREKFPLFTTYGFENGGFSTANEFTGPIDDRGSLASVCAALETRADRGIQSCLEELGSIPQGGAFDAFRAVRAEGSLIFLLMYQGRFEEAATWAERAYDHAGLPGVPDGLQANLRALRGVIELRRGEVDNCQACVGPSSCIFPLDEQAIHRRQSGSREAIRHFTEYLHQRPDDLGVRWLLNVAYMTLGEYPDKVPREYLITLDRFRSKLDFGRFTNVAAKVGLGVRGPNMAGGSIFDDFTGDGLPDVFTTAYDLDLGASLFVNRGDGHFDDRSESAGLKGQVYSVNCAQGDYDNDGLLDVIMVRGGWENPAPLSLLHNLGDGRFEDVTRAAGLGDPIASQCAVWGDYDNDGLLDLFVCGEYVSDASDALFTEKSTLVAEKVNRCRLYRNLGGGKFEDIAERAGVWNERYAKAAVCGDFDGDGFLDIFVSNCGQENRLYHNGGDGTFEDVAPRLGLTEPRGGFSCGVLDFDNDGRLDLFVVGYTGWVNDWATNVLEPYTKPVSHAYLFKNMGAGGFCDISAQVGLNRMALGMGLGVGDRTRTASWTFTSPRGDRTTRRSCPTFCTRMWRAGASRT